ncbi:TPA: toxin YdaT family protein [Citrobacter freundii]
MKINEIKSMALELEEWAMKDGRKGGWKKIVPLITAHHYGDLLDSLADIVDPSEYARRLHNNTQIIQRAFRNDTPNYRGQAAALAPAIRAAMDAELAGQHDLHNLVAIANRECIEATSAVLTGKPMQVIRKETAEAIQALADLIPGVSIQFNHIGPRAA